MLVRTVGPTLGAFGLTGVLADPALTLLDANGATVAANNNWTAGQAEILTAAGAFPLPAGSRVAAVPTELPPGNYSVPACGGGQSTGLAIAEVYDVTQVTSPTTASAPPA